MPTGGVDIGALAAAFGGGDLAAGAASALGTAALGGEVGAGIGGITSAVEGQNPLSGAIKGGLEGGITGGGIGIGGDVLGSTLGTTAADALGGAAGGALGGLATGGNVGTSALEGGAAGGLAGALSPSTAAGATAAPSGGSGASAAGTAAPAGVGAGGGDVTLGDVSSPVPTDFGTGAGTAAPATQGTNINLSGDGSTVQGGGLNQTLAANSASGAGTGSTASTNLPWLNAAASPGATPQEQNFINNASNSAATTDAGGSIAGGGAGTGNTPAVSSGKNFIDNFSTKNLGLNATNGSNFANMLESNPGALISGGALLKDAITGNRPVSGEGALKTEASQMTQQGQQLEGYLQSGTLPPGLQAGITQQADAAKAAIKSRYAASGMTGSSAEQQELSAVDQQSQAAGSQIAMQLLNTGISESQGGSKLYEDIIQNALKQDDELGSAFGSFGASLMGGASLNKQPQSTTSAT